MSGVQNQRGERMMNDRRRLICTPRQTDAFEVQDRQQALRVQRGEQSGEIHRTYAEVPQTHVGDVMKQSLAPGELIENDALENRGEFQPLNFVKDIR